jgi:hypothetical protein
VANHLIDHDLSNARATGDPVLLTGDGSSPGLDRIDLASATYNEAWLQQLVFDNPQLLPVMSIEPGFGRLQPVAMEVPCGHGYIDNLYVTGSGEIVLVEVKLWRNPQARREVVAQALDYIAALTGMGFEPFEAACRKGKGMAAATLHALVAEQGEALDEASFIDALSRNLVRGRVLVLVLGDGIRSEVESLAGLLQSHAGAHFTFALIELALWLDQRDGAMIAVPSTLARTEMIQRGVVTIEDGKATVTASAEPEARGHSISQETFFEELAKQDATLPASIERFLRLVEPLGVYPEFKASLNLKADIAGFPRAMNFGYVTRAGKLWTDTLSSLASSEISQRYNQSLAALTGGEVATSSSGHCYVSTNGKSAPAIGALLPKHAEAWAAAIGQAIEALQASAAAESPVSAQPLHDPPAIALSEQAPGNLIFSFEEAYEAGLPLVGIVDGVPRSPVMGFIRLADGFAWCDDGILAVMGSGNPLHSVAGEVNEKGSTIRCDHTELKPIDPDDRVVLDYWNEAVAHFGSTQAMHAHAEKLLREMFGAESIQEEQGSSALVMLRFKGAALEQLGLPDIDYPVPSELVEQALASDGELPLAEMLFGLQLHSRQGATDWQALEPAMARLAELMAPEGDDRPLVDAAGETWWLEIGPVDLSEEIVTIQRREELVAAIAPRDDGRLRVAAYRPLDAKSAEYLIGLALRPHPEHGVCMRANNWEYARDGSFGMGNHYAYDRGEAHLSYWEKGIGYTRDGEEVPHWLAKRGLAPRTPAHVAMELGVHYGFSD